MRRAADTAGTDDDKASLFTGFRPANVCMYACMLVLLYEDVACMSAMYCTIM